jgi:hypothetical protein
MRDWKAVDSFVSPHLHTLCWVLFRHYRNFKKKEGSKAEPRGKMENFTHL